MSNLEKTLEFTPNFMTNQTALSVAIFERITGVRLADVKLLPITCNWTCYIGLPFYSKRPGLSGGAVSAPPKNRHHSSKQRDFRRQGTFTVRTCEGDSVKDNLKYREGDFSHASPPGAEEKLSGWGSDWWRGGENGPRYQRLLRVGLGGRVLIVPLTSKNSRKHGPEN